MNKKKDCSWVFILIIVAIAIIVLMMNEPYDTSSNFHVGISLGKWSLK